MTVNNPKGMEDEELLAAAGDYSSFSFPPLPDGKFKPWHHPRKQWVRAKQWANHTGKLLKILKSRQSKVISYLTLPGEDLLDIRELRKLCENHNFSIKYLGFNTSFTNDSESTIDINHNELRTMKSIHSSSHIERDRLELIANETSVAYKRFDNNGPFDVINIDLCNSIAVHSSKSKDSNYYDMLQSMLNYQFKNRTESWLLFITSSVKPSEINPDAVNAFGRITNENIEEHEIFKQKLIELIERSEIDIDGYLTGEIADSPKNLVNIFGISFCKWLLKLGLSAEPKWLMNLEDVCYYKIRDNSASMLSLAIKFDRISKPSVDRYSLAKNNPQPISTPTEVDQALSILSKLVTNIDLDSHLEENPELLARMISASSDILVESRYSKDEYLKWCKDELGLTV